MEAALPRLNVQPIPNGPAMPEGWVAPDPIGDLMGAVQDPFGDSTVIDGVDPNQGQPYQTARPQDDRPAAAEPARRRDDSPDQRPEPEPEPERPTSPLFF
jgi:penicillin-binding protein 1A